MMLSAIVTQSLRVYPPDRSIAKRPYGRRSYMAQSNQRTTASIFDTRSNFASA